MRICILTTRFSGWHTNNHTNYILEPTRALRIEGFHHRVVPQFLYTLAGLFTALITLLWKPCLPRDGRVDEVIQ